jgi:hypothetical protein
LQNSAFRLEDKLCNFYVPNVSEMLRNTLKHHFGSNGVEWMLHLHYTEIVARNTNFAYFYMTKFSEMLLNTPKHQFASNGVEWMPHNFFTPK